MPFLHTTFRTRTQIGPWQPKQLSALRLSERLFAPEFPLRQPLGKGVGRILSLAKRNDFGRSGVVRVGGQTPFGLAPADAMGTRFFPLARPRFPVVIRKAPIRGHRVRNSHPPQVRPSILSRSHPYAKCRKSAPAGSADCPGSPFLPLDPENPLCHHHSPLPRVQRLSMMTEVITHFYA